VDAGEGTTMSDRIFLFIYTGVSLMIVLSILRISRPVTQSRWISKSLSVAHIVVIPLLVVMMAFYVYRASLGEHGGSVWPRLGAILTLSSG
jgi:glucan phosphoethanolaminetransferase (alkaline phosphatase superfamily)